MKRIMAAVLLVAFAASIASAAITVNSIHYSTIGTRKLIIADIDLDASYRNGGESLTPAMLSLSTVYFVQASCDLDGYLLQYDYSAEKLVAYAQIDSVAGAGDVPAAFADIAPDTNAVDLSGVTGVKVFAIGN